MKFLQNAEKKGENQRKREKSTGAKKRKNQRNGKKHKIDEIDETETKKKVSPTPHEAVSTIQNDDANEVDVLIDMHATIIIEGLRYDGIIEQKGNDSHGNVIYKVKFDSPNARQSEWVKRNQIEIQKIVTCDNFQTGDDVQVRENGEWMDLNDAAAKIIQIFEGATGAKIYKVVFPELGDYYMYRNEKDIRKY